MRFAYVAWSIYLSLILSSCATTSVYHNLPFDKSAKTIRMDPGSSGLGVQLKQFFKTKGFQILSHSGDVVTKQTDEKTQVTSSEHKARYALKLDSTREDSCITGGAMWVYSLSIVDVDKGEEVLSMGGRDCDHNIVSRLEKELGY